MARRKDQPVRLTSREFEEIFRDLVEYDKRNSNRVVREGAAGSFPTQVLEHISYIGDQLSFLTDWAFNESLPNNANEPKNLIKHGRSRGFRFNSSPSSVGFVEIYATVPVSPGGTGPDTRYMATIRRGSEFASVNGSTFTLLTDVDLSDPNNLIVVSTVDDNTGAPTGYAVRARGAVISGEVKQEFIEIGAFERFRKVRLLESNISQIISVADAEGKEYHIVDFLSQDVIFRPVINRDAATNELAKSIMRPFPVPRRCQVVYERNGVYLQFGHGGEEDITDSSPVDPSNILLDMHERNYLTDQDFDPTNLISSDKLGIVPSNTTLNVVYRVNSTNNVNANVGSITSVVRPIVEFKDPSVLNISKMSDVRESIEVDNEEPIVGDISFPTNDELRTRMFDSYARQNRAVTARDYVSTAYAMPAEYGGIKRATIFRDEDAFRNNLNMYVVCESADGSLVNANDIIKKNLKVWLQQYKMVNDTIDILDAKIINVGIDFEIVTIPGSDRTAALSRATSALTTHFLSKMEIGQPLSIVEVYRILNKTEGVADAVHVDVVRKFGGSYSDTTFNISKAKTADGRYIEPPEDSIIEVKFPTTDIRGKVR